MKHLIQLILIGLSGIALQAQSGFILEEGTISFMTSKKVYVKFDRTDNIEVSDTLFLTKDTGLNPVLVVENKSSSSTVCQAISTQKLAVGDQIFNKRTIKRPKKAQKEQVKYEPFPKEPLAFDNDPIVKPVEEEPVESVLFKEKIKGRISAASYSNFSGLRDAHRMRYAFSFRGHHLNNSRISTDSYITFRHTLNDSINVGDALKVYSLSIKYDFTPTTSITFGRKINPRFSSMGAIDGLQFETGIGGFQFGVIAGTRPDFRNYGWNLNLLQFGTYVGFNGWNNQKTATTTLGLVEQMNSGKTDRRFVYFQHSGKLAKQVHLFTSIELDLYENINDEAKNRTQLTNLYISLRYRLNRKWRFSAAYDTRQNIIYYESYKNFIDQLIEDESRQGFRFSVNHRPFKTISWGINTGLRFQKSQQNPSRNISGHLTFSEIPWLKARATLRANLLETDFLDSQIFGIRIAKELIRGKLNAEVFYRWVDYRYQIGDRTLHQDIIGASLSYRIRKDLSIYLFHEGVLDSNKEYYHRFNMKLIKRF